MKESTEYVVYNQKSIKSGTSFHVCITCNYGRKVSINDPLFYTRPSRMVRGKEVIIHK